ncbi:S26 family signal peptidase [Sphingorhabdus sp. YGSMI21]|uniref:S26 family signal peptidase n=1 Tax=Sphingorhabdus sp. YGSMI21 TaxID=2077182 RepID=UPI000C1EF75A|nr:S26 family signal peptidase [Sphingorhabdus sp. YGSMI21]ATW05707.1 type VI secretion protein [Sphingorhabdus sp. YGSMI21]
MSGVPSLDAQKAIEPRRSSWPSWKILGALLGAFFLWSALNDWSDRHAFMINSSESLPNWAFFVQKNVRPARGQYVFFIAPKTPLIRSHFGDDPKPFGKRVYGVAGDIVSREGKVVSVNGVEVASIKPFSKRGEPLTAGPVGRVPEGCYFMATESRDGFDSRYADIGWVCGSQIFGTGVPVL